MARKPWAIVISIWKLNNRLTCFAKSQISSCARHKLINFLSILSPIKKSWSLRWKLSIIIDFVPKLTEKKVETIFIAINQTQIEILRSKWNRSVFNAIFQKINLTFVSWVSLWLSVKTFKNWKKNQIQQSFKMLNFLKSLTLETSQISVIFDIAFNWKFLRYFKKI